MLLVLFLFNLRLANKRDKRQAEIMKGIHRLMAWSIMRQ